RVVHTVETIRKSLSNPFGKISRGSFGGTAAAQPLGGMRHRPLYGDSGPRQTRQKLQRKRGGGVLSSIGAGSYRPRALFAFPQPRSESGRTFRLPHLMNSFFEQEQLLREGGGEKGRKRQARLGRLPVRERLSILLDHANDF